MYVDVIYEDHIETIWVDIESGDPNADDYEIVEPE